MDDLTLDQLSDPDYALPIIREYLNGGGILSPAWALALVNEIAKLWEEMGINNEETIKDERAHAPNPRQKGETMETTDELLTALFNSTDWVLACAQQDRQKQYELIRSVIESAKRHLGVHLSHCNFGAHAGACKYGDTDCPALAGWSWFGQALDRHP